jgi:hypothetical protein
LHWFGSDSRSIQVDIFDRSREKVRRKHEHAQGKAQSEWSSTRSWIVLALNPFNQKYLMTNRGSTFSID